jgi:hypothetical protein
MGAETIKEFLVAISFDIDEQSKKKFNDGVKQATKLAIGLSSAVIAINSAITAFAVKAAKDIEKITNLGSRIRATTNEIERMGFIASLTGSDLDDVTSSLDNLSILIGKAATGVGGNIFIEYGIEARKANGEIKTTFEMLSEIRSLLNRMAEPQRAAFLQQLGISPNLMRALSEDTSKAAAEFDELYRIIGVDSVKAAKASSDFMDIIFRLNFIFSTLKKKIAVEAMPLIAASFEKLRKNMIKYLPLIADKTIVLVKKFLKLYEGLGDIAVRAVLVFKPFAEWLVELNDKTNGWLATIFSIIVAWRQLNLEFLLSPLGMVLALAAAFVLLKDDYDVFMRDGDSLIDWSGEIGKNMKTLIGIMEWVGDAIEGAFTKGMDAMKAFRTFAEGDFKKTLKDLIPDWMKAEPSDRIADFKEQRQSPWEWMQDLISSNKGNSFSFNKNKTAPIINQTTTINVSSTDPDAAGRAVAREQGNIISDIANSFKGTPQ